MKSFTLESFMRRCPAIFAALLLASCGGSDDNGNVANTSNGSNAANTPSGVATAENITVLRSTFSARLTGAQETPPVASAATATGLAIVDPATRVLKATVTTVDIIGTAVHIQEAAPGAAGPIVFPLTEISASGIWTAQVTLTAAQLRSLRAGNYYFNVRSAAFPNGEMRGQIL